MLRVGEIEHGRRCSGFAALDLADVAREAFELYEPLAEENGLALILQVAGRAPVLGDRELLLEATGNLLDNAFKYAAAGSDVLLRMTGAPGPGRLSVADGGPGIPAGDRERLLRRFQRGQHSATVGGSGLSLSIVAAITRLHGFGLIIDDTAPGCMVSIECPTVA